MLKTIEHNLTYRIIFIFLRFFYIDKNKFKKLFSTIRYVVIVDVFFYYKNAIRKSQSKCNKPLKWFSNKVNNKRTLLINYSKSISNSLVLCFTCCFQFSSIILIVD